MFRTLRKSGLGAESKNKKRNRSAKENKRVGGREEERKGDKIFLKSSDPKYICIYDKGGIFLR